MSFGNKPATLEEKLSRLQSRLAKGRDAGTLSAEELKAYGEAQARQFQRQVSQEARQARMNRLMGAGDIDMERYNFGTFDPSRLPGGDRMLEAAWGYANQQLTGLNNQCLILLGDHGTGKTHLAMAVLSHIRQQGQRCVLGKQWRNLAPELLFTGNQNEEVRKERQRLRQMVVREAEVLLLDEVGAAQYALSAAQQQELGQLLRQRVNLGLPTVITSNHKTLPELAAAISPFALEGVMESQPLVLLFEGASQRKAAQVISNRPQAGDQSQASYDPWAPRRMR